MTSSSQACSCRVHPLMVHVFWSCGAISSQSTPRSSGHAMVSESLTMVSCHTPNSGLALTRTRYAHYILMGHHVLALVVMVF